MANILLHQFDLHIVSEYADELLFYCRFVDDCLAISDRDSAASFSGIASSWQPCIKTEVTQPSGLVVNYLDLILDLGTYHCPGSYGGQVSFSLYRKPLNIYQYLPRSSCHPSNVFRSLIFCEASRVLRRCSSLPHAESELKFFTRKLLDKGYPMQEILSAFASAKHAFASGQPIVRVSSVSSSVNHPVRKAFLKLKHSSSVNYRFLRSALQRHKCLLSSRIFVCSRVQHSIFRLLYPLMWSSNQARGGRD